MILSCLHEMGVVLQRTEGGAWQEGPGVAFPFTCSLQPVLDYSFKWQLSLAGLSCRRSRSRISEHTSQT